MISIVVVSHSRALAQAAVALAAEMLPERGGPAIEVAAGLDPTTSAGPGSALSDARTATHGVTGTDAAAVADAMVRAGHAAGQDGVLVLLDLGSAVLSAEMALELVEPDLARRVMLSPAPLVEGLVAAVVAAGAGLDLAAVAREAEAGLRSKASQLGHGDTDAPSTNDAVAGTGEKAEGGSAAAAAGSADPRRHEGDVDDVVDAPSVELSVLSEHGLHARPAARVVALAGSVAPDTTLELRDLTSGRGPVDALSLTAVATLDAQRGNVLLAQARGPRAQEVLYRLVELAARGFSDRELPKAPLAVVPVAEQGSIAPSVSPEPGVAGSGLDAAVGPVVRTDVHLEPPENGGAEATEDTDIVVEQAAWRSAVDTAVERLGELRARALRHLGEGEAEVFEAHSLLLRDPQIHADVEARVAAGQPATTAWPASIHQAAARFADLSDPYQRERAQDVRGIGERVQRLLLGLEEPEQLAHGVLVVDELDPALAISLDTRMVQGVITRSGGVTGHGVLIATARGVPVLTGAGEAIDVPSGTTVAFDVRSGRLEVDPSPDVLAEFEQVLADRLAERARALERSGQPVVLRDGVTLVVRANVASLSEARFATTMGAHGSGLVRSEAVFARWRTAPTVQEQVEVYSQIAQACAPYPVTLRTWDVGGDKPLLFIPTPVETNPFLGARGLRAFVEDPQILLDQVEAICRVARDQEISVLFPMVATRSDVAFAVDLVKSAMRRAGSGGGAPKVGIMIETPAAAIEAASLTTGLDFVSIGTNDLTQYVLAAERGNPVLQRWSDPLEPAVLALIRRVCDEVPVGLPVGLCGSMAADPDLAGLLVGLGITELSASVSSVPLVKERLRHASSAQLREVADQALVCADAGAVRALLARRAG